MDNPIADSTAATVIIQRAIACPRIEVVKKDCIRKLKDIDNNIISIHIKIKIILERLITIPNTLKTNKTTGKTSKFVTLLSI
jgi:hypothetical protein